MKIAQLLLGGSALSLFLAVNANAQNVGIGVSSPQSKLSVNGTTSSGGLAIGDSTYTSTAGTVAPTNGAMIQGFTCIGTTKPRGRFAVVNDNGKNGGLNAQISLVSYGTFHVTDFETYNARGTEAAPTNLGNGDLLGGLYFNGFVNNIATVGLSGVGSTYRGDGTTTLSDMEFGVSGATHMYIDPSGNVGINTGVVTPLAPLEVTGSTAVTETNVTQTYFSFGAVSNLIHNTGVNGTNTASAVFHDNVWSSSIFVSFSGSLTASDARLKNVIGHSDSAKDLETLKKIEITDYTMKDVVREGDPPSKKVIAQQVEKVYPAAVKTIGYKGLTFTPDIYAVSSSVKCDGQNAYTISLGKTHGLKEGETVRLITEKNLQLRVVAHVVNDTTFTVTTKEPLGDKVFVYGKQCLDLKGVDYDAIAMLNVSATQELAKELEALERENSELRNETKRLTAIEGQDRRTITKQEAQIEKLTAVAADMEALKKTVARMQEKENGGVRTAVLEQ
jgi:Chaperone of endosialidase